MNQETIKTKFNFSAIEPRSASVPQPVERKSFGTGRYISFGEDNLYPNYLLGCYDQCSTLQSIINGLADYMTGNGFVSGQPELVINEKGEALGDLVRKCAVDYLIFGAFSLGVRRAKDKEIRFLDYHDPRSIRLNEEGDTAYYCKDWSVTSRRTVEAIPIFNPKNTNADVMELYVKNPTSRTLYGHPIWGSAIKEVQTAIEISTFHLSAILNNFAPSAIVNFNNGQPEEATQKDIEKRLNDKFSGATNAARLLVVWNETKDNAADIQRLSEDNFDQRYNALSKSVRENIFIAFRAQPQLFGADPEHTGFNSIEYQQSFKLYKTTVVRPLQSQIERAFAQLGDDFRFELAEFNIDFDTNTPEI